MMLALITARAGSLRLRGKNLLPVGGIPLWLRSVRFAEEHLAPRGVTVAIDTDDETILDQAPGLVEKATIVRRRDPELAEDRGGTHAAAVRRACSELGADDLVLLQPTSPFRSAEVLRRCLNRYQPGGTTAVCTVSRSHFAEMTSGVCINRHRDIELFDGNLLITPSHSIFFAPEVVGIRNDHLCSLQIDSFEDYQQALLYQDYFR